VRHRIRRIEARRSALGQGGYSFVEVIISLLLASVIVTSVFSVALTSKSMNGTHGRNEREQAAGQAIKEISGTLRYFVTGCRDISGACNPVGTGSCGSLQGPNLGQASPSDWSLNHYPTSNGVITDSLGSVYALKTGTHCLTGVLPPWFETPVAPYNAQLCYTVVAGPAYALPAAFPATQNLPTVTFNVNWTEP
jgi:hypothetical protein